MLKNQTGIRKSKETLTVRGIPRKNTRHSF